MRIRLASAVAALSLPFFAGCAVQYRPAAVREQTITQEENEDVAQATPVIEGPGVLLIDVEPAPDERVYVYDPGFPPGCYFYNNYYWYRGYRYEHDVFIRYVHVNIQKHRFTNVSKNRAIGRGIERRHHAAHENASKTHSPNSASNNGKSAGPTPNTKRSADKPTQSTPKPIATKPPPKPITTPPPKPTTGGIPKKR